VYRAVSQLHSLLENVVVPQANLYTLLNGEGSETTVDELMLSIGIDYDTSYHVLLTAENYWSRDVDL
jgi:hypothetical protein